MANLFRCGGGSTGPKVIEGVMSYIEMDNTIDVVKNGVLQSGYSLGGYSAYDNYFNFTAESDGIKATRNSYSPGSYISSIHLAISKSGNVRLISPEWLTKVKLKLTSNKNFYRVGNFTSYPNSNEASGYGANINIYRDVEASNSFDGIINAFTDVVQEDKCYHSISSSSSYDKYVDVNISRASGEIEYTEGDWIKVEELSITGLLFNIECKSFKEGDIIHFELNQRYFDENYSTSSIPFDVSNGIRINGTLYDIDVNNLVSGEYYIYFNGTSFVQINSNMVTYVDGVEQDVEVSRLDFASTCGFNKDNYNTTSIGYATYYYGVFNYKDTIAYVTTSTSYTSDNQQCYITINLYTYKPASKTFTLLKTYSNAISYSFNHNTYAYVLDGGVIAQYDYANDCLIVAHQIKYAQNSSYAPFQSGQVVRINSIGNYATYTSLSFNQNNTANQTKYYYLIPMYYNNTKRVVAVLMWTANAGTQYASVYKYSYLLNSNGTTTEMSYLETNYAYIASNRRIVCNDDVNKKTYSLYFESTNITTLAKAHVYLFNTTLGSATEITLDYADYNTWLNSRSLITPSVNHYLPKSSNPIGCYQGYVAGKYLLAGLTVYANSPQQSVVSVPFAVDLESNKWVHIKEDVTELITEPTSQQRARFYASIGGEIKTFKGDANSRDVYTVEPNALELTSYTL